LLPAQQVSSPLTTGRPTAYTHPNHQLEALQVKAKQYSTHGLADSTQRTYSAPQCQYLAFCSRLDLSPFPASKQTLMLFVTELASRIQLQSIPMYLSAIRALHIAHGYPNPLDDILQFCQTVPGINRLHGITAKQKLVITTELRSDMKQFISLSSHDDYIKWSAMVSRHFFFLLRCGEFTILHPKDFHPDQHLTLLMFNFVPRLMVPSLSPSGLKLLRQISFGDRTLSSPDTAKVTSALSAAFKR